MKKDKKDNKCRYCGYTEKCMNYDCDLCGYCHNPEWVIDEIERRKNEKKSSRTCR